MRENVITSSQSPLVKHFVKLRTNKKYRHQKKAVFLEGKKLLEQLNYPLETLIVREKEHSHLRAKHTQFVSKSVFHKLSGLQSPEGIAAEVKMPPWANVSKKKLILALDEINDPGNLGTLIRTALALGFEGLFCTRSCVDPYNEKALRAAKGATFTLPMQRKSLETKGFHIYVAALEGTPCTSVTFETPAILILGNEARGVSKQMRNMGTPITIPMQKKMESLNVASAGAILIHAMGCQKEVHV